MFREMRRSAQILPQDAVEEILNTTKTGILSVSGDDDYPYGVPVNFAYADGKIFFHCALTGHKIDGITRNEKVSFCVVAKDDLNMPQYTTDYRSVILFGRARILDSDAEKNFAMEKILEKYPSPYSPETDHEKIITSLNAMHLVEITIDHISGKENKILAAARKTESK